MTNPMESELIRLRALEPEDVNILYKWENDTEIWKVRQHGRPVFEKNISCDSLSKTSNAISTKPASCG